MSIQFSQALVKHLPQYLGISLGELSKEFPMSRITLYKLADGSIPINDNTNNYLNKLWKDRGMDSDDLVNLYSLIDIVEAGSKKERAYALKQHRKRKSVQ